MRRIVSIILSMLMIVSMCTFVSFGASAEELVLPTEPTLEELTNKDGYTPLTLDMIFTEGRQGVELKKDFDMAGKYYLAENITLREACLKLGFLSAERFDEVFKPEKMV